MWVEVTEIHFFATFYYSSVWLLKCPLGGNESDACHTHTHTLQFQRSCFSVHIIQFHVHVIIPFIHNQSPSVAFHSTHRHTVVVAELLVLLPLLFLLLIFLLLVKGTRVELTCQVTGEKWQRKNIIWTVVWGVFHPCSQPPLAIWRTRRRRQNFYVRRVPYTACDPGGDGEKV